MGVLGAVPFAEIKARGSIDGADVLRLRRNTSEGCRITADEAQALLALNDACPVQDPAWADWFVETLTDFIVHQTEPAGHLTADNAAWLIARVSRHGRIATRTAMDLVLGVLERARLVPPSLVHFALEQVKDAAIDGGGPLRCGDPCVPRTVGAGHVELMRRIMCAFDGDGDLPVTQPEAELLFDVDAATAGSDNDPSWQELFVKAVGNCVLAALGYAVPGRARTLAGGAGGAPRPIGGLGLAPDPACRLLSGAECEIARLARQRIEIVTGEPLVLADASWLAGRIEGDRPWSPNARALLRFLEATGAALSPASRRWWAGLRRGGNRE